MALARRTRMAASRASSFARDSGMDVLATAIASSFYVVRPLLPRFEYHLLTKIQALPRDTRDVISTPAGGHMAGCSGCRHGRYCDLMVSA
jgi:hypothetical protein